MVRNGPRQKKSAGATSIWEIARDFQRIKTIALVHARAMERMTLKVLECRREAAGKGVSALVVGLSETNVHGDPEVKLLMRLRLPPGASKSAAYDLALKYLDVG